MIHTTERLVNNSHDPFGTSSGADLFRLHDKNNVISSSNSDGPSFIFYRGCGEDYRAQAPIFVRKLGALGAMHFPYQVGGVHDQAVVDEGVIEACERDGDRERVLVATSMGQMNMMRSLMNSDVRVALGEGSLRAIFLLSGMSSRADLQPSMQWASGFSAHAIGLPGVGTAWQAYRRFKASGQIPHSDNTTSGETKIHYMSSASMDPKLVGSQHKEIYGSQPWSDGALAHITAQNPGIKLVQITADHDGVVNRHRALISTQRAFHAPVMPRIDTQRFVGSHADDIEFIEPLAEEMAKIRGVSHQLLVSAVNLEACYALSRT